MTARGRWGRARSRDSLPAGTCQHCGRPDAQRHYADLLGVRDLCPGCVERLNAMGYDWRRDRRGCK